MARERQYRSDGPADRLKSEASGLVEALADRAMSSVRDEIENATGRLTNYVEGGGPADGRGDRRQGLAEGKSPARSALSAGFAGIKEKVSGTVRRQEGRHGRPAEAQGHQHRGDDRRGCPPPVAYNQWTQFRSSRPSRRRSRTSSGPGRGSKAQLEGTGLLVAPDLGRHLLEQVPDERIVWRSKGAKGHVDGAVTFHEVTPDLTRILLVLEYHPQGLFERTGNIWRAQGRRARLELKHFPRHVMSNVLLNPDDVEGWRGVIEDGEVVKDHETALEEEQRDRGEEPDENQPDEASADRRSRDEEPEARQDDEVGDEETGHEETGDEEGPEDEYAQEADGEAAPARGRGRGPDERLASRRRAGAGSAARTRRAAPARVGRSR